MFINYQRAAVRPAGRVDRRRNATRGAQEIARDVRRIERRRYERR